MVSRCRVVGSGGASRVKTAMRGSMIQSFGFLPIATMSACFVTAQKGSQQSDSIQCTGSCRRSQVHSGCG